MRNLRILLWALVAAAMVGLGALILLRGNGAGDRRIKSSETKLAVGGPFTLTGGDGKPFSSTDLSGTPYVVFFGFTHCPDVCPTTLARLVRLRDQLGEGGKEPAIVFITVDPDRDGPSEVGKYAQLFNAPIIGLTGSPAQIEQVKKQFGIYSAKVPDGSGGYSVDHTASALLFDRRENFIATIAPGEPDSAALEKMKRIVAADK